MPTNVKENGFESSIVSWLVQHNGYEQGSNADYNKEIAMDETRLFRFLNTTQADKMKQLRLETTLWKRKNSCSGWIKVSIPMA